MYVKMVEGKRDNIYIHFDFTKNNGYIKEAYILYDV